jgi:nicotinate-nucleotide--dimethylbenzimidazole phosphoribosyltransferase
MNQTLLSANPSLAPLTDPQTAAAPELDPVPSDSAEIAALAPGIHGDKAMPKSIAPKHYQPPSTFVLPVIESVTNVRLERKLRHKMDQKTKPQGALGLLEDLAVQMGLIQRTDVVTFREPQMVVFAADHGIAAENVSAYPQAVTAQMVANMLSGGAAINVLARQHGFVLHVVDAGVASELDDHPGLLKRKVALGTGNMCRQPAMTLPQMDQALQSGAEVMRSLPGNVVAFGEMGIANTSSASLILTRLTRTPIRDSCGRGTGLTEDQFAHKRKMLMIASLHHRRAATPLQVLAAMGGFEIAMMVGAMLQAASQRRLVLVDGFIAGAAALVAQRLVPEVQHYMVFCHQSAERGHRKLLHHLKARPLLDLDMRLGEGTGALLAWPLLQSAAKLMSEMASFASAGVSHKATD